ncbi:MAG: c-type cytochrome [Bryobacterales bacterium]
MPALLDAISTTEDPALLHSLTFAMIEIDDPAPVRAGLTSPSPQVRRAALIALDQMHSSGIRSNDVLPLLSSSEPLMQETANWIAVRHADWGGQLAGRFRGLLNQSMPEDKRAAMEKQLGAFASDAAIQGLLAQQASAGGVQARVSALNVMAAHPPKPAPTAWTAGIVSALGAGNADVQRAAVAAARSLDKDDAAAVQAALGKLGRSSAPADVRLAALSAASGQTFDASLFDYVRANLSTDRPIADRANAARALAHANLTAEQQLTLADSLKEAGPMELPVLLEAFAQGGDAALGAKLLASLGDAKARSSLRPDLIETTLEKFPAEVQQKSEELLASLDEARASQRAELDTLVANLHGGDIRRGQSVFNSEKAGCSSCHRIGYLGGRIGPDLTRIGEIREEKDLVEAVVFPSASFVRSFEPVVVETPDDIFNGVIVDETENMMLLATGAKSEERIARASIEDVRPGTVSIMPSGLKDELSPQELSDLIAFLKNARRGPN